MSIEILPSIDISNGNAVKRIRGKRGSGIIVGDAKKVARDIFALGYDKIHIVDLDAAERIGNNERIIREIVKMGFKYVQVGGGIDDPQKADRLVSLGVSRIILSTVVFSDIDVARNIIKKVGEDKIIISLDYDSSGTIMIKGWNLPSVSIYDAINLVNSLEPNGVIFTYINNEGLMRGIDAKVKEYVAMLNDAIRIREYSGGVNSIDDLKLLNEYGFNYAIVGMAFYTGKLKGVSVVS